VLSLECHRHHKELSKLTEPRSSASAFAAATIIRSGLAAAFPLFAKQMLHNLGVEWAITLLALLAVLLAPVPVLFYFYGGRIRAKSSFALEETGPPSLKTSENPGEEEGKEEGSLRSLGYSTRSSAAQADGDLERILSGESNWMGSVRTVTRQETNRSRVLNENRRVLREARAGGEGAQLENRRE
jgi:hypothetical protein